MIVPIGTEDASERAVPWITVVIILLNIAAFVTLGIDAQRQASGVQSGFREIFRYWSEHPYLDLPPEILDLVADASDTEQLKAFIETVAAPPESDVAVQRTFEQQELNTKINKVLAEGGVDPYEKWGLIPAKVRPTAVLTSMFMHASWQHLVGNLLWLWVTAPFLERAFGRVLFAVLYVVSGTAAAFVHVGADLGSMIPLVGASGAIAGLMGAFLVRFSRVKIRFFYWIFFVFIGTFGVAAWILMPLWFVLQVLAVKMFGNEMGTALWAHIGGFMFGAAFAYVVGLVGLEERFSGHRRAQRRETDNQADLAKGQAALAAGNARLAHQAYTRALDAQTSSREANFGLWQAAVLGGRAQEGVEHLAQVIESELREGQWDVASSHWYEMRNEAGQGGPPVIRFKLAKTLERHDVSVARDIYMSLVDDSAAGALAGKAVRRLAELAVSDSERAEWLQRLETVK